MDKINKTEALKDIVCAMIASGDYTYKDTKDVSWDAALNYSWNVVWHGDVVEHAASTLEKIINKASEKK